MSNFLAAVFFFAFGAIVGSFLNVVIYRLGTGFSIVRGRSKCFSCGKTLRWFELLPILSYLFLKRKCSACESKISIQYPIVEFCAGLLFVLLFSRFLIGQYSVLLLFIYLVIFSVLLVITVYDIRHKIIPQQLVIIFVVSSLFTALSRFFDQTYFSELSRYLNLFAGILLFLPFYGLWKFSDGRWIGLGDGKLAIGIGTLLGLPEGLSAIVLGFWIGAIFALVALFIQKNDLLKGVRHLTMKSEIPFAPFLILGTLIAFLYPLDIFSLHLFGM
jgi:leader peptidase (prepilin peptidase)/N-methyltransferase